MQNRMSKTLYIHTHIHTHAGVLLSPYKTKSHHMQLYGWIKGIMLSEISQTQEDKYCVI